jgi:hypothetical protein
VNVGTLPSTGSSNLLEIDDGAQFGTIRVQSTGVIEARAGTGSWQTGPTLVTNRWYRLDVRYDASGTTAHVLEWQVDGNPQPIATWATAGATSSTTIAIGTWQRSAAATTVVRFDDYAVSNTAADWPIGPGAVLGMRPDGAGTSLNPTDFQHDDNGAVSVSTGLRVDDDPFGSVTDYVKQVNAVAGSYIELTLEDVDTRFTADGVRGVVGFHSLNTNATSGTAAVVRSGSPVNFFNAGTVSVGSTIRFQGGMVSAPGGGWTAATLNGSRTRFGYTGAFGGGTNRPYWDAILVEAAIPQ